MGIPAIGQHLGRGVRCDVGKYEAVGKAENLGEDLVKILFGDVFQDICRDHTVERTLRRRRIFGDPWIIEGDGIDAPIFGNGTNYLSAPEVQGIFL
jgi:hypothetical protein